MKKETKEEFREVFTYDNFKRLQAENSEFKDKISELKGQVSQVIEKQEEITDFIIKMRNSAEKDKNE